ncbi:MAG: 7TM-DISM domain-containing protein [Myxococcota bacterium]
MAPPLHLTQVRAVARRLQAAPLLLSMVGLLQAGVALSAESLILDDEGGRFPLGLHLEILEDPQGVWTIDDVDSPPLRERFVASDREIPNLGLTHSVYWLRFHLSNATSVPRSWLLEIDWPLFDLIDFYYRQDSGEWAVRRAGERVPSSQWELPYRNPMFRVPLSRGESRTYYVRFEGEDTMLFPLTLWSAEAFERSRTRSSAWLSLYYGILIGLIAYHLLLFLLLRDRDCPAPC